MDVVWAGRIITLAGDKRMKSHACFIPVRLLLLLLRLQLLLPLLRLPLLLLLLPRRAHTPPPPGAPLGEKTCTQQYGAI